MRVGRDTVPAYLVQRFFLSEKYSVGLIPSTTLASGYYKGPVTLMNHVNKGLKRMATDKVQAKLSYSTVTHVAHVSRHRVDHNLPQCDGTHVRIP